MRTEEGSGTFLLSIWDFSRLMDSFICGIRDQRKNEPRDRMMKIRNVVPLTSVECQARSLQSPDTIQLHCLCYVFSDYTFATFRDVKKRSYGSCVQRVENEKLEAKPNLCCSRCTVHSTDGSSTKGNEWGTWSTSNVILCLEMLTQIMLRLLISFTFFLDLEIDQFWRIWSLDASWFAWLHAKNLCGIRKTYVDCGFITFKH